MRDLNKQDCNSIGGGVEELNSSVEGYAFALDALIVFGGGAALGYWDYYYSNGDVK